MIWNCGELRPVRAAEGPTEHVVRDFCFVEECEMRLIGIFFVISFGFRFSITVEVCFDQRARHNAIFAAGDQEQWRARVVMKSDGAWRVRTKVRKRNLPQNTIRSRNDVTLECCDRCDVAYRIGKVVMKLLRS